MEKRLSSASLRGTVQVPGDKSVSHRALMFGALARGVSRARNLADSADCRATRRIMEALGARVTDLGDGEIGVEGPGLDGLGEPADVLDAANSGTTTRLMIGILAARPCYAVLTGDATLSQWAQKAISVDEELKALRAIHGAEVEAKEKLFYGPRSVKLDEAGHVIVADSCRHRLQIYQRL